MADKGSSIKTDDVSIVLCGQAGRGIQTVEYFLTRIMKSVGYNVFSTKEYMSRVRGGMNSIQIRVSSKPVQAFVEKIDVLIMLDKGAISHLKERVSSETLVLGEKKNLEGVHDLTQFNFKNVDFTGTAVDIGGKIYSNVVAVGVIAGMFGIESGVVFDYVRSFFSAKSSDVIDKNIQAAEAGYQLSEQINFKYIVEKDAAVSEQMLLGGADAVGLGAIAGGCDFISSYPMSPSTAVLVFLAKQSEQFGIIVEQAEDEIAAINMALGASYAGSRAMVTTSGGGFALMTEGLSLSAMLEVPVVIHLAQRPGPATGLPTRTEQGDLEFALYAGHGEFGRVILTPGTLSDGFQLTCKAFELADKYQVPVFVLTDQYFMDSYYNTSRFDLSDVEIEKHIVETSRDYKRYQITADGISPRGIPGFGEGLVAVDSDEHDEAGHITEDLDLRTRMVDKRLKKVELLKEDIIEPELVGTDDFKNLLICWGSTYNVVREAVEELDRDDLALLHFKQVYPLPGSTSSYLKKAQKTIIIENNATAQFAKLIKLHTGVEIDERILKYNGLSFTVEEVRDKLNKILG